MKSKYLLILFLSISYISFCKSSIFNSFSIAETLSEIPYKSTLQDTNYIEGDINKDGEFNFVDVVIAVQILNEGNKNQYDSSIADTDNDGKLTHKDISHLASRLISEPSIDNPIDAIFVTSTDLSFKSECFLLKNRPQIIYKKDKMIVRTIDSNDLEIPFTYDSKIKVELGKYNNTGIEYLTNNQEIIKESKTYIINNKIIIYHKGVRYNINGTLYK